MVLRELVTAWRLAASPTTRSPDFVNATTDGVVRLPSEFSSTSGSPLSMTAMQEFVVPKSMPNTFAIKMFCKMVFDLTAWISYASPVPPDENFENSENKWKHGYF